MERRGSKENADQEKKKKEKTEERQLPHQKQLAVESIKVLAKLHEIISEKRCDYECKKTMWSNVYKQYQCLKRKPTDFRKWKNILGRG